MGPLTIAYAAVYALSIVSVAAIVYAIFSFSAKRGIRLDAERVRLLTVEELHRLRTRDPVFIMHLSIILGIGLSIAVVIVEPFWLLVPFLRPALLIVSFPIIGGLFVSLVWRVLRYIESKRVEKELLHKTELFSHASSILQMILIIAILFTTTELIIGWFSNLAIVDAGLNIARNSLVVVYYSKPTVNLVEYFDRPLSLVRTPFKLSDVLAGNIDPSQVKIGASRLSEFEPYEKLSYDSCVEIGACESACPATAAGRPLSPRVLVRELSLLDGKNGNDADALREVNEDELWSCTTCGACVSSCPVAVKHLDIIYDLRRSLVNFGKLDKTKVTLIQSLAQNRNPYGFSSSSRADWAKELGIDTLSSNPGVEYLYWVGCISAFDPRAQKIAKSVAKILKSAGISFAILGSEEMCNGDPARRLGEEGRYQELAYQNIEKINSYGIKKIITACPHCYNTIRNEYPAFGGNYEVVHYTQLISELIGEQKIRVSPDKMKNISLTLHDACYASRYNDISDEPRDILKSTGANVREMRHKKEKTFCCGAGGSNYWYKVPQQRTIAGIRTTEACRTGAKIIVTECPFCLSMLEDSAKTTEAKIEVRDIAEIVAETLRTGI